MDKGFDTCKKDLIIGSIIAASILLGACALFYIFEWIRGSGSIKGAITWQYSETIGTKPDVGADIILLPKVVPKKILTGEAGSSFAYTSDLPEGYYRTEANGYGYYEISNVKVGEYYILIISNNTDRDPLGKDDEYDFIKEIILPDYLSPKNIEKFYKAIGLRKITWESVNIRSKQTAEVSHDFGYTEI